MNCRKDAPFCYDGTYTILPVVVQQVPLSPDEKKCSGANRHKMAGFWCARANAKNKSRLPLFYQYFLPAMLKNRFVPRKTLIYVCEDRTCQIPVLIVKEALILLQK